jgi:hypothetical protein
VVSIVSIILTIVTLKEQKRHNLKSVKPIGRITAGDYENDIYVSILNNGIGPLIIKDFLAKNNRISSKTGLIDIVPTDINNSVIWTDFASNFETRAIKAGERLYLLRLTFEEQADQNQETIKTKLRNFLKDLTIELQYTDIYEKRTYKIVRELDWFGRHLEANAHRQKRSTQAAKPT